MMLTTFLCKNLVSILYHTIPYHTIPYRTVPYHTIPYHTIPYHTIPYHTILYHTILSYTYCRNLDETTKSVYKENISLSEAITYHTTQSEQLQSKVDTLASEIASLKDEKELNGMLVQKKVVESKKHKRQIKEVSNI